jgi:hypothetical protein
MVAISACPCLNVQIHGHLDTATTTPTENNEDISLSLPTLKQPWRRVRLGLGGVQVRWPLFATIEEKLGVSLGQGMNEKHDYVDSSQSNGDTSTMIDNQIDSETIQRTCASWTVTCRLCGKMVAASLSSSVALVSADALVR